MMKKIYSLFFLFLFLYINEPCFAKIENKIILKIENEIITDYEIKNKILTTLFLAKRNVSQENINDLKRQALESLIRLKLKKIELEKYDIPKDINKINGYLFNLFPNIKAPEIKKRFEINNLNYDIFIKEIETQVKWQSFIYQLYSNRIEINEKIIEEDLEKILRESSSLKEFNISEIEILIDNMSEYNNEILRIKNQIKKLGFETTATKFSISSTSQKKGNLGWVNANSLSAEIFKMVENLNPGDITEPIKRQNTILILKLNDIRSVEKKNINKLDLKKKLINQKKNELFNLYSNSHLSKLRNTSLIEYK